MEQVNLVRKRFEVLIIKRDGDDAELNHRADKFLGLVKMKARVVHLSPRPGS